MDDDFGYTGEKRQRGGRKKRKKNREEEMVEEEDWDEIYDPSRPTNYRAYLHSEERVRAEREWKDRLYAHRKKRPSTRDTSSDDNDGPKNSMIVSSIECEIWRILTRLQTGLLLRVALRHHPTSTTCLPLPLHCPTIHPGKMPSRAVLA